MKAPVLDASVVLLRAGVDGLAVGTAGRQAGGPGWLLHPITSVRLCRTGICCSPWQEAHWVTLVTATDPVSAWTAGQSSESHLATNLAGLAELCRTPESPPSSLEAGSRLVRELANVPFMTAAKVSW